MKGKNSPKDMCMNNARPNIADALDNLCLSTGGRYFVDSWIYSKID